MRIEAKEQDTLNEIASFINVRDEDMARHGQAVKSTRLKRLCFLISRVLVGDLGPIS